MAYHPTAINTVNPRFVPIKALNQSSWDLHNAQQNPGVRSVADVNELDMPVAV